MAEESDTDGSGREVVYTQAQSHTEDVTGRFVRSDKKLGHGTIKLVYQARDEEEGVDVAWNELDMTRATHAVCSKFLNEIAILEGLEHPNILKCTTHFQEGSKVVFITELMPGGTLKTFISQSKNHRLKLRVTQKICRQLVKALDYLHSQSPPVVHSNLMCENIFIDAHNCEAKLADFGLSGRLGTVDSTGHRLEFMAPEIMATSGTYTCQGDVYAFGMCVLEMVGQYPYAECNADQAAIQQKVQSGQLPQGLDLIALDEYKINDHDIHTNVRDFIIYCIVPVEQRPSSAQLSSHPFICISIPPEHSIHPPIEHPASLGTSSIGTFSQSSSPSPVVSNTAQTYFPVVSPQSPRSPIEGYVYQSDTASVQSQAHNTDDRVASGEIADADLQEVDLKDDQQSALLDSRRNSWPMARQQLVERFSLTLDGKLFLRRTSAHSSSPEHLDSLPEHVDSPPPELGRPLAHFSHRRRHSVHASTQSSREDLSHWQGIDPFSGEIYDIPFTFGFGTLHNSFNTSQCHVIHEMDLSMSVKTPSEGSSLLHSPMSHLPHQEVPSPTSSNQAQLHHLDCEAGNGTLIQKLLDEEEEVKERLRQAERDYKDRVARRNAQFKKLEEEFKRNGVKLPTVAAPKPAPKLLSVHRESVVSTHSDPEPITRGRTLGSDLDLYDAGTPLTTSDTHRQKRPGMHSPILPDSPVVNLGGFKKPEAPASQTVASLASPVAHSDAASSNSKAPQQVIRSMDADTLLQTALEQFNGSFKDPGPAPLRPKSPIRPKSPVVNCRSSDV